MTAASPRGKAICLRRGGSRRSPLEGLVVSVPRPTVDRLAPRAGERISRRGCCSVAVALLVALLPFRAHSMLRRSESRLVVFVCEHGAAKSVIAAEIFNQAAARQGLPFAAVARGVDPDPEVMRVVRERLFSSGRQPVPTKLSPELARCASLIVSFTAIPVELLDGQEPLRWSSPSVSVDYASAEQAISRQVLGLVSALAAGSTAMPP